MQFRRWLVVLGFCAVLVSPAAAQSQAAPAQSLKDQMPHLLPWSQQIAVREGWLVKRQALLIDMMRRHNVDMWIVVRRISRRPAHEFVAPPRLHRQTRFFVFVDTGDKGQKKIAVTGYS